MHIIKAYQTSVTLFSVDGDVYVYPTLARAMKELGYAWIVENVANEFVTFSHVERRLADDGESWVERPVYRSANYVMRDDAGQALTWVDFDALRPRYRPKWLIRYDQLRNWSGVGPVPGIHRRRGGHSYRRPKTTQERRWAIPMEDEPAPRARRSATSLRDAWDDYPVSAYRDRNWKRYRRTQWKQY